MFGFLRLAKNWRWFRFSLRSLFVVVTAASVWFGWQASIVRERRELRAWIESQGGWVSPYLCLHNTWPLPIVYRKLQWQDERISGVRRWMGDEVTTTICLPTETTQDVRNRVLRAFPLAEVTKHPTGQEVAELYDPLTMAPRDQRFSILGPN